jgi:molybdenum cofactor cytidylyltransferase
MISVVLLAAGAARRFGSQKLLAPVRGVPLARLSAERLLLQPMDELVVVLGHDGCLVGAALDGLPVRYAVNTHPEAGMSASIRAGVGAVSPHSDALIVALGDQPLADPGLPGVLVRRWRETNAQVVAPRYAGMQGTPVLFVRSLYPELLALDGDRGAREVVRRDAGRVAFVDVPSPMPADVDTPADLAGVREL